MRRSTGSRLHGEYCTILAVDYFLADSYGRPRVIPLGGRNDPINEKGLEYYSKLVDALLAAGIEPVVTLYHWDLPDELYRRYRGPLNKEEFVADFTRYARVVFDALGPRVKKWITFNEPWCISVLGYNTGKHAPGRTSDRKLSPEGDGSREPWIVGHTLLVAHGTVVDIYRREYKEKHGGEIGITLNGTLHFHSHAFPTKVVRVWA